MNSKLILVGASAVSLAAGAAGGYFFAKRQFLLKLDTEVAREVDATKKHYGVLMTNLQYGPKPSLDEVVAKYASEDDALPLEAEEEVEEATEVIKPKIEFVDYQKFAVGKPESADTVIESNIFTSQTPKPPLPPRDVEEEIAVLEQPAVPQTLEPYPIDEETFLINDPEHEQESVLYFANEDTVVMAHDYDNRIENDIIGEFQLHKLTNSENPIIYIRNPQLETDYQVTLTTDSLAEALGLNT